MTLHEATNRLFDHALLGYINGEKFTKDRLYKQVASAFRDEVSLKIPHTYVLEVCLPDGRWFCSINHYAQKPDGFDYFIPDNREQEKRLIDAFFGEVTK